MRLSGQSVAVTGATGFIGRYIVRALQAEGANVVGVVRNPDKLPWLKTLGVTLKRADLADRDALCEAFRGADAIISNAGLISLGNYSKEAVIAANLEGTRNVFYAAIDAGVGRALMTSSVSVYRGKRGVYREDDALRELEDRTHRFNVYGISKAAAERAAVKICEREGLPLTVARPGGVYGAFDYRGFTLWFARLMQVPATLFPTHLPLPNVYTGALANPFGPPLTHEKTPALI